MEKKIKAWAVVWVEPNASSYGMKHGTLISSTDEETDAEAIFATRAQAEKWRDGNLDWKTIPCTITYKLPKSNK